MASLTSYYRLNVPFSVEGLGTGAVNEVHSFDEWVGIICPGNPSQLAYYIDSYPSWFTVVATPSVGGDGLVLASPADTTRETLDQKIAVGAGVTKSIQNPGANEKLLLSASGTGAGTVLSDYRNTAGSLVIPLTGAWADISFPTAVTVSSSVTKLGGDIEFEFNETGSYQVYPNITVESGDTMVRKQMRLMLDTGGGYAQVGVTIFSSNPSTVNDESTVSAMIPISVSATDKLKVQVRTDGGSTNGVLHAEGNSLSIARFDPPVPTWITAATTTTTAAPVTIATIAIPATTTVVIDGLVAARRTGGVAGTAEDAAGYRLSAAYKNIAGAATLVGSGSLVVGGEDQASWSVAFGTSGGNAMIRVSGDTDNNVNWVLSYRTVSVS